MYWAPKNVIWAFLNFSIFDQKNRLLGLLEGILWEGWRCLWSLSLDIRFSKILSHYMFISDLWFGQESISSKIKNVISKFNFKLSNSLHMSKAHICIGNYINIILIVLGYYHVKLYYLAVIIIVLVVSPEISRSIILCRCLAKIGFLLTVQWNNNLEKILLLNTDIKGQ